MANKATKSIVLGLSRLKTVYPQSEWENAAKSELLARFSMNRGNFYPVLQPVFIALIAFFAIVGSGVGVSSASQKSLPGDSLYPVKLLTERAFLNMPWNQERKTALRAEILRKRIYEAQELGEYQFLQPEIVQQVAEQFNSDFKELKKEIAVRNGKTIGDSELLNDKGALPVEDGRVALTILKNPDLEKMLKDAGESLDANDLQTAFARTEDIGKLAADASKKKESVNINQEENKKEIPQENVQDSSNQQIQQNVAPIEPTKKPESKNVSGAKKYTKKNPSKKLSASVKESFDFNIDVSKESRFGGFMIKEK